MRTFAKFKLILDCQRVICVSCEREAINIPHVLKKVRMWNYLCNRFRPPFTSRKIPGTHLYWRLRLEGLGQFKTPMNSSGMGRCERGVLPARRR
jgi:hypothetical protein